MTTKFLPMNDFINYQMEFVLKTGGMVRMATEKKTAETVLSELIDAYYNLDKRIKNLTEQKNKIKSKLISAFNENNLQEAEGFTASLKLTPIESYNYKPELWEKLSPEVIKYFTPPAEPNITETALKAGLKQGIIGGEDLELIQLHKELKETNYRVVAKPLMERGD